MQPQTDNDYKKMFTELIKKQIVILGPDITMAKVRNVQGIQTSESGEVTGIQGDPQAILQQLINQFVELSGAIVKKTMESILTTYPGMAAMASGAIAGGVSTAPTQVSPLNQPQNITPVTPVTMGANPFSDPVSRNETQVAPITSNSSEKVGLPKEEMDSINKALSEMGTKPLETEKNTGLENSADNVSKLNN